MSLRLLLALLLTGSIVLVLGFVFYSSRLLEDHIVAILPSTTDSGTASAVHLLVFDQFLALVVFGISVVVIMFWLFGLFIVRPLQRLVRVVSTFSAENIEVPTDDFSSWIFEIQLLGQTFQEFMKRVSEAHKKDTDISRVKSDFISTAAHQLRTPLTGIRWALEALENENLTEEQKALVKNAVDKSHDLVAVVGTLLDISSIESGKYAYKFEVFEMGDLVAEVAKDFVLLAEKSNVALFYAKESMESMLVNADRERIKWVLNNLVENAIRYTPSPGTVRLTTETSSGLVYVRVKDSGIGIQDKDKDNIFERFYRAGNAITKENKGNGLGLYIARTIATDHGGDLNFFGNTDGPGTTFVLSLPAAP